MLAVHFPIVQWSCSVVPSASRYHHARNKMYEGSSDGYRQQKQTAIANLIYTNVPTMMACIHCKIVDGGGI